MDVTSWPSGAIDVESPELGISCSELGVGSSVRPKSRTDFAFQHLSTGVAPFYTNLLATPINASRSAGLFRAAPPAAGRSVLHDDRGPPSAKIILVHRTPPTSGHSPASKFKEDTPTFDDKIVDVLARRGCQNSLL